MQWPWSRKRHTFDGSYKPLDAFLLELAGGVSNSPVTRASAMSVPAVQRGRNEICAIATMPLVQHGPDNQVADSALLRQLDPDVPNVVTLSQTIEDLLLDGLSWWLVTAKDFAGFPVSVRHLDVGSVSVNPPSGQNTAPLPSGLDPRGSTVWVYGRPVSADRIIRFDSPNPAVLKVAGRAIRRAIVLDQAAQMYADDPRPLDYFEPRDGADPASDDEIAQLLAKWQAARKQRGTGYVPASLAYHTVDAPSPQELQLVELSRQVNLDVANSMGIDPEDLGISTTSRTYSNDVDRRRNKLNEVLAPYMRAVTDRLSTGDVTRRGYTVRFNTTEYLQPNPTERWGVYSTAKAMGAMTIDEIRAAEGLPPLPEPVEPEVPEVPETTEIPEAPEGGETPAEAEASASPAITFDTGRSLTFADVPVVSFSVDREHRIIEGLALPYGPVANNGGYSYRFEAGSLQVSDVPRVKLLRDHDPSQPLGKAMQLRDTPDGFFARFKVARGPEGDRALELAEDGVLDGLSVGVDFVPIDTVPDPRDKSVRLVRRADLREVSLTALPAFDDARVTKVAASRTQGGPVPEENTGPDAPTTDPEPSGLELNQDQLTALLTRPGAMDALRQSLAITPGGADTGAAAPEGALTLSADQVDALIRSGQFASMLGLPAGTPEPEPERPVVVDPTRQLNLSMVREELPYRFDRGGNFQRSDHDFSTDLHEMALAQDHRGEHTDAGRRVMALFTEVFSTESRLGFITPTGDVNEANYPINRPDMFVDQRDYRYPIWEAINKGAPPNGVQPFLFPRYATSSGLVADHVEGTEPTAGAYTLTQQTVTPTALSGKASLTREVWDMGGNPAVSTLVFNQMLRGWREGLEASAATFLAAQAASVTDIVIPAGAADEVLAAAWESALADLQFIRGYDFSVFAVEKVLYGRFVAARDSAGRVLYPIIGPSNANGSASPRFRQLDLAGVLGTPSWALASTAGAPNNSWLFDPMYVSGWASAPQRLEFPGTDAAGGYAPVAMVDIGIWGYKAFAVTDFGGVRQVIYDSVV